MNIQEIRQEYPQYDHLSDEQLASALHQKFYSQLPYAEFKARVGMAAPAEKPEPSTLSRAAAGAAGYNDSMLAGLPGLPVDTALNVADMVRAGYGYVGGKTGLLKPEELPAPLDRKNFVGSADWIRNKLRDAGAGVVIDNPNPGDSISQFLNTAARNLAGARSPGQAAAGTAAGLSQATAEQAGFGPEGQIIASMLPQAGGAAARAGTRQALGGNEAQRKDMRQNIQTLQDAGVDRPSAGLVGTRTAAAIEALAGRYPGSAGLLAQNAKDTQAGLGARTKAIADEVAMNRGEAPTGLQIQQDITGRWKPKFDALYERLDDAASSKIGDQRVPIANTLATTGELTAGIPGAPSVSRMLIGKSIPAIDRALTADANIPAAEQAKALSSAQRDLAAARAAYERAATMDTDALKANDYYPVPGMPRVPASLSPFPTETQPGAVDALRAMRAAEARVSSLQAGLDGASPTLPYPALRGIGSMIGKEAGDSLLHGTAEAGRYKQIYGGIAQDKAAAADAAGAGRDLSRANAFYSKGADKMETVLQPYTRNGVTPEQAYNQFRSTILSSPGKAYDLRKSLSADTRKMQTATLIDELGQATPGRQDANGSLFSSETFLTNWNKISPNSKAVMFSGFPEANNVRTDLEKIAKAAELIRNKGGIYANPSGTAGAMGQIGIAGVLGVGAATGNVPMLATTLGSVAGANITARMMTNPKFVNWLASSEGVISPQAVNHHRLRLAIIAQNTKDPELRQDLQQFAAALPQ